MTTNSKVLNLNAHSTKMFFGDEGPGICRYDVLRHTIFDTMDERMRALYWNPTEVDLSQDGASFRKLSDSGQFAFTANLQRQIVFDSLQGRSPGIVFIPHCTDSSVENCWNDVAFFESIHSRSYTHIIKAVYPNPTAVIDAIPGIRELANCTNSITQAYDRMARSPNKENLYLALIAANALEGLRFFPSFATTFSFAERGDMEGSAKIVKMIARDELMHLAFISHILKRLPKDDPEFVQIMGDLRPQAIKIFDDTAEEEKAWQPYVFQHGNLMGMNEKIACDYIDYLLPRRKSSAFLTTTNKFDSSNPIPWSDNWLTDSRSQPAPQEVESTAYLTSSLKNDSSELNLDFEL